MKPVIGLLLIAGGIVLMYGLFTGKINFPGYGAFTNQPTGSSLSAPGGIQGNVVSNLPTATPQNRKLGQGYAPR